MARKQKLKVYRTPIGFHDAYVAATSQKAALKAWGADVDLFGRGVAELVTDEALTSAPLASPGEVIRRARGTSDEHMKALPKDTPRKRKRTTTPNEDEGPPPRRARSSGSSSARSERPKPARVEEKPSSPPASERKAKRQTSPRPSRVKLDAAEEEMERARREHEAAVAEIRHEERTLQQKRRALEQRYEKETARREASLARIRERYSVALQKWRG